MPIAARTAGVAGTIAAKKEPSGSWPRSQKRQEPQTPQRGGVETEGGRMSPQVAVFLGIIMLALLLRLYIEYLQDEK